MLRSWTTTIAFWWLMACGVCVKGLDSPVLPLYLVSRVAIFGKPRRAIWVLPLVLD